MQAKVIIPPSVEVEIALIGDYIAQDNPSAAKKLMEQLLAKCLSLRELPHRGRQYGKKYRFLVENSYLIFYRVEEDQGQVTVIIAAVVHAARDITSLLDL